MAHGEFFLLGAYTVVLVESAGRRLLARRCWRRRSCSPLLGLAARGAGDPPRLPPLHRHHPRHLGPLARAQAGGDRGASARPRSRSRTRSRARSRSSARSIPPIACSSWPWRSWSPPAPSLLFYRTRLGLAARGVIANRAMAASLGIDTRRMDRATFAFGAALAGFAGAVMAPLMSVDPQMGVGFLVPAFLVDPGRRRRQPAGRAARHFADRRLEYRGRELLDPGRRPNRRLQPGDPDHPGLPAGPDRRPALR